jgi:hypothetical protein
VRWHAGLHPTTTIPEKNTTVMHDGNRKLLVMETACPGFSSHIASPSEAHQALIATFARPVSSSFLRFVRFDI